MSVKIIIPSNDDGFSDDELTHYGVPGMKWGHRRKITVRESAQNVRRARKQAVKKLNDSPEKHTMHQYKSAVRKASKETIAKDKARNKHAKRSAKGRKKANSLMTKSVRASAKTISYGAQFATRLMQNNITYGTTGAIFDHIYG